MKNGKAIVARMSEMASIRLSSIILFISSRFVKKRI